ncbi:hypothetical protein K1X22_09875 [Mycolicibacterium farcinogenes]|uniref:hypothetical protein n=1 Tax=Mycolicibacterium farcinogenes TaxID=1802 RepID=UPI001C8E58BA|nr:hypothetical protein [Mycolicibacterium farcinogenes]QZH61975.1 hypothetical protein K1X22_09875 [Mycolicibacterium farcinogenes]
MRKFGIPAVLVSGLATTLLGLAAPASAGVDHHLWVHQMHQKATVPQVDTTVKHTNVNRTSTMSNR